MSFFQICAILLYLAAGLCIFLVLFNRYLILLPERRTKAPAIVAVFVAICGAAVLAGLSLDRTPWVFAPAAVLGFISVGEARRAFIRRSCTGSKPIDSPPHEALFTHPFTTTDLITHRFEVNHPKWSGPRLRIALLTDLHVHPRMSAAYYQRVLEVAEQTQPDLAVFTGDFVANQDCIPRLRQVLRPIAATETFAVLGNHDYWTNPEAISSAVKAAGLRLLRDESVTVAVKGNTTTVTGYDYPWGTKEQAIPPSQGDRLHLVLSHTPDNIYRLAQSHADIVFSGHYHAGQIRLPLLGPIVVPSVYGRRFDQGHFVVNGTHLFVASGIGASNPMLRIYCRPEIVVVDIVGAPRDDAKKETPGAELFSPPMPTN
jgi:predicted MPP superfamily phosphohydrolase